GVEACANLENLSRAVTPSGNETSMTTRRDFLTASAAALAMPAVAAAADAPWYRRAYRWGQTNIVEKDPVRYDIDWWRRHWKETQAQAVIINAGGVVAYYPSKVPLHPRAEV